MSSVVYAGAFLAKPPMFQGVCVGVMNTTTQFELDELVCGERGVTDKCSEFQRQGES